MGKPTKPSKVTADKIGADYNWGEFGSADSSGVNFSPMATQTISDTQAGLNQYVNELINPSYDNESFRARQAILDANNRQFANELGAQAMERGARGSATQNILNSIMANRNANMRQAMTQEDARVQNIINALAGVENNYFNQGNTMANNILARVRANQDAQNKANIINTSYKNQYKSAVDKWKQGIYSSIGEAAGAAIGGYFGGPMGAYSGGQAGKILGGAGQGVSDYSGAVTNDGMYGAFGGF
jgi:hypothetical protein